MSEISRKNKNKIEIGMKMFLRPHFSLKRFYNKNLRMEQHMSQFNSEQLNS